MSDLRNTEKAFLTSVYNAKSTEELINLINKYYHPKIVQREAGQPAKEGLETVLAAEKGFFSMLEKGHFDGVEIHSIVVDGNHTFVEHTGQAQFKGAPAPYPVHQVVEHEWKDGKIIKETFWHEKK